MRKLVHQDSWLVATLNRGHC